MSLQDVTPGQLETAKREVASMSPSIRAATKRALQLHAWNNTPEEWARLKALSQ